MGNTPVRRNSLNSAAVKFVPLSLQNLTGVPTLAKKLRTAVMRRRAVVLQFWNGTTYGQPLNWSTMTRKWRPLTVPRSACTCSNGRDAGSWGRSGSRWWDGSLLVHSSQLLATLVMSLSMFGQYTVRRARWRSLVAPWCISSRSCRMCRRKLFGMTNRMPTTIMPSVSSITS